MHSYRDAKGRYSKPPSGTRWDANVGRLRDLRGRFLSSRAGGASAGLEPNPAQRTAESAQTELFPEPKPPSDTLGSLPAATELPSGPDSTTEGEAETVDEDDDDLDFEEAEFDDEDGDEDEDEEGDGEGDGDGESEASGGGDGYMPGREGELENMDFETDLTHLDFEEAEIEDPTGT